MFNENKGRYGYRRIYGLLGKEGCTVSEKVVRRIMKQENLVVKIRKKRKYSSYREEISPAVSNVI
jgi:transposase InsO family protein